MSTNSEHAVVPVQQPTPVIQFTEEQIGLLKRQVCKPRDRDATDDELALFMAQCVRTGLDPFDNQIYAIFRKDHRQGGVEVMRIQTGIDGFRLIAERTKKYLGQEPMQWCGEDEVWRQVWLPDDRPKASKATVHRIVEDKIATVSAVAHWAEYADADNSMWARMPRNQLAKCAEALALRKAFPNDLSGIYTTDEIVEPARVEATPRSSTQVANDVELRDASEACRKLRPDLNATLFVREKLLHSFQRAGYEGVPLGAIKTLQALAWWADQPEAQLEAPNPLPINEEATT